MLCIVMEIADNGALNQRLKVQQGKKLAEDVVWNYFIQIVLGLQHIHSKKILHRDVKSMNVFLDSHDVVKIGDLGVARVLGTSTNFAHTVIGTPYYLSPELCEDKPYNEKSDVWALGCILYELCTLKHPFDAANQGALILKIIRGRYPPITSNYSSQLADILDKCLTRDTARRPDTADILLQPNVVAKARSLSLWDDWPPAIRDRFIKMENAPPGTSLLVRQAAAKTVTIPVNGLSTQMLASLDENNVAEVPAIAHKNIRRGPGKVIRGKRPPRKAPPTARQPLQPVSTPPPHPFGLAIAGAAAPAMALVPPSSAPYIPSQQRASVPILPPHTPSVGHLPTPWAPPSNRPSTGAPPPPPPPHKPLTPPLAKPPSTPSQQQLRKCPSVSSQGSSDHEIAEVRNLPDTVLHVRSPQLVSSDQQPVPVPPFLPPRQRSGPTVAQLLEIDAALSQQISLSSPTPPAPPSSLPQKMITPSSSAHLTKPTSKPSSPATPTPTTTTTTTKPNSPLA
eukprot:CAMPEP_0184654578 /NCGR_PEP_ID=MMETSP0308-20130426/12240_1 /TAXON_ID=38269 /ORGANISM="Gloeochaete witrockiana, Strain SAG 46.84" /LENGTH=508 /DNA_ID=CAMNT_0027090621 /DNA_START=1 /DNA_END=1523 /DNA_ORIENTATION=+